MRNRFVLAALLLCGLWSCDGQREVGYTYMDVSSFKAKMTEPNVVLLDVRTPEETALGMIKGASQLDFQSDNFEPEVEKLDKTKTYLVYCQAGSRSSKVCKYMAKKGFKNLYSLEGGYLAWTDK